MCVRMLGQSPWDECIERWTGTNVIARAYVCTGKDRGKVGCVVLRRTQSGYFDKLFTSTRAALDRATRMWPAAAHAMLHCYAHRASWCMPPIRCASACAFRCQSVRAARANSQKPWPTAALCANASLGRQLYNLLHMIGCSILIRDLSVRSLV